MREGKISKLVTENNVFILAVITLIICIYALALLFPEDRTVFIRRELARQGHCLNDVDFEFIKRYRVGPSWIYKSSVPIYHEGQYVSYWLLLRHPSSTFGITAFWRHSVEPYYYEANDNFTNKYHLSKIAVSIFNLEKYLFQGFDVTASRLFLSQKQEVSIGNNMD